MIPNIENDFLLESNAIEEEYDWASFYYARKAWKFLKKIPPGNLTIHSILRVHDILMTPHLSKNIRGNFRDVHVYVGSHVGMEPKLLFGEMLDLLSDLNSSNITEYLKDDWCKKTHVKFEKIHPFVDGNGRTGRMLFNWHRLKLGLPLLVIKAKHKYDYYKWFRETFKEENFPISEIK